MANIGYAPLIKRHIKALYNILRPGNNQQVMVIGGVVSPLAHNSLGAIVCDSTPARKEQFMGAEFPRATRGRAKAIPVIDAFIKARPVKEPISSPPRDLRANSAEHICRHGGHRSRLRTAVQPEYRAG